MRQSDGNLVRIMVLISNMPGTRLFQRSKGVVLRSKTELSCEIAREEITYLPLPIIFARFKWYPFVAKHSATSSLDG